MKKKINSYRQKLTKLCGNLRITHIFNGIIIIIIIINSSIYLVLIRLLVLYLLFRLKASSFFQCLIIIFLKKIKK